MTKLLEKALEAVRRLPPDSQDQIARVMLTLSGNEDEPEEIDPAQRCQVATDAEVEAAFRCCETREDQRRRALDRMAARNWTPPQNYRFERDEANER